MASRIVLDSSVLIAASRPAEAAHADALAFVGRLREACATGLAEAFAPAELWVEVYVAEQKQAHASGRAPVRALAGLAVELVAPESLEAVTGFLERLTARTRGRKPFTNATDLVYLWAAFQVGAAALVTLDRGLMAYDRIFCEVRQPADVWFG